MRRYHDALEMVAEDERKNMDGQVRLAAHRFLDLGERFLKSRYSLLEQMKERISLGWLKAVARVIYNSGGRIEPVPKPAL